MSQSFLDINIPKKTTETAFILVEINDSDDTYQCQHFITKRNLCSQETMDQCPFCGSWTCYAHFDWEKLILIDADTSDPMKVNPCDSCSTLPDEDLLKIRTLRLEINS